MLLIYAQNAHAYIVSGDVAAWNDDPYDIEVETPQLIDVFGMYTSLRWITIVKSSVFSWLNLGIDIPRNIHFHDYPYSDNDTDINADFCCDGNCTSGCPGKARYPYGSGSDDCEVILYSLGVCAASWSDDRSNSCDFQGILTHEFGHCLGLDEHGSPPETVMTADLEYQAYPMRFPRVDDVNGSRYTQGMDSWPMYYRTRGYSTWSYMNELTAGMPSVTDVYYGGYSWHVYAWISTEATPGYVVWKVEREGGGFGPVCHANLSGYQPTFDGVAVSAQAVGFAIAYREYNDNAYIRVIRGLVPSLTSCGGYNTWNQLLTPSPRRPSLAYDVNSNRLILAYIDKFNGNIKYRTAVSTNGFGAERTFPETQPEFTDTPVAISCGYWNSAGSYRCFLAFPKADGQHRWRLCRGYIDAGGVLQKDNCTDSTGTYYPANVAGSVIIENGNKVRIMYTGTDDNRTLNYIIYDCSTGSCIWSNSLSNGSTPTGPAMSGSREVHAGY